MFYMFSNMRRYTLHDLTRDVKEARETVAREKIAVEAAEAVLNSDLLGKTCTKRLESQLAALLPLYRVRYSNKAYNGADTSQPNISIEDESTYAVLYLCARDERKVDPDFIRQQRESAIKEAERNQRAIERAESIYVRYKEIEAQIDAFREDVSRLDADWMIPRPEMTDAELDAARNVVAQATQTGDIAEIQNEILEYDRKKALTGDTSQEVEPVIEAANNRVSELFTYRQARDGEHVSVDFSELGAALAGIADAAKEAQK